MNRLVRTPKRLRRNSYFALQSFFYARAGEQFKQSSFTTVQVQAVEIP